jgi:hypothetical protein
VAASRAAENPIFVLKTDRVDIVEVQELSSTPIGGDIAFRQFKPHAWRVGVASRRVVDCQGKAIRLWVFTAYRLAQVSCEGRNPTLAWQIVAYNGNVS